jgi:hypothetical protein
MGGETRADKHVWMDYGVLGRLPKRVNPVHRGKLGKDHGHPNGCKGNGPSGWPAEGHQPDPMLRFHSVGHCADEEAKS